MERSSHPIIAFIDSVLDFVISVTDELTKMAKSSDDEFYGTFFQFVFGFVFLAVITLKASFSLLKWIVNKLT